jgi:hypothetical protein
MTRNTRVTYHADESIVESKCQVITRGSSLSTDCVCPITTTNWMILARVLSLAHHRAKAKPAWSADYFTRVIR